MFSSYRFPTSRFIERYERPLLVIHGDADSIIPYTAGKRVFDRAPAGRKTLVTIPRADHNDLHVVNPAMYWQAIGEFVGSLPDAPESRRLRNGSRRDADPGTDELADWRSPIVPVEHRDRDVTS